MLDNNETAPAAGKGTLTKSVGILPALRRGAERRKRAFAGMTDERLTLRQRGVAVLDFIFYTIFAVVATGSLLAIYAYGRSSSNVNEAITEVGTIQTLIQTLYGASGSYTGLTQNVLASSNELATKYYSGNNLVSPFGNIQVSATTGGAGYNIVLPTVSQSACAALATTSIGTASETVYVVGANANANATGALTPAQASTACAGGSSAITYSFAN